MIINAIVAYYEAVNCTISTVTLRSVGSREMACRLADKEMIVLSCAQANKRLRSVCKESSPSMHTETHGFCSACGIMMPGASAGR